MPEGRADAGGGGEHGSDARHHRHLDVAPRGLSRLDCLEYRARHGEHTWIARGHDGDGLTFGGKIERLAGAGKLFTIVGKMAALAGTLRHAGKIGRVANEVGGGGKRLGGTRRDQLSRAGPEADNGEAPSHSGFL